MAVFFLLLGLILLFINMIIAVIEKIKRKKLGYMYWSLLTLAIAIVIVSFIEIPVREYNSVPKESKTVKTSAVKSHKAKIMNLYSMENGESIIIQYDNKNILVDIPSYVSKPQDKNNIFNILDSHGIKKVDVLILTSNDEKAVNNILSVIGKYNINNIIYADSSIKGTKMDNEIVSNVKAINDVKKSSIYPAVMNDKQNIYDMDVENKKSEDGTELNFKLPKNVKGILDLDSYDSNIHNSSVYDHKIKISYDVEGYISLKIISKVDENKD
ncbi:MULTISPECIES: hypothetical protein [Clostridium]|uniref:hypothetical protein n=1 Tax=Clostridium TaxID=1485 RepID=UPI0008266777|nr:MULTISPECIES: hypothetical protein [Clostridium]PJI09493.1 hypothetical protein CUB90_17190 [Clostridium sp. CT7]